MRPKTYGQTLNLSKLRESSFENRFYSVQLLQVIYEANTWKNIFAEDGHQVDGRSVIQVFKLKEEI